MHRSSHPRFRRVCGIAGVVASMVCLAGFGAVTGIPKAPVVVAQAPVLSESPKIVWPTPNTAFKDGKGIDAWTQDTGTGDPRSGLFGLVRDNGTRFHEGIDIRATMRDRSGEPLDPVFAAMDGQVAYINNKPGNSNYGRYIVIEHPGFDVPVYTLYGHLAAIQPDLQVGDSVFAGNVIARMGHSSSDGIPKDRAHLHFEVGVRLTDNFAPFYESKKFTTPNEHGNYNGQNLVGADPLKFFETVRAGKFHSFAEYFRQMPTAFTLRATTARTPDFLKRYPALAAGPVPKGGLGGWDVDFTWYGLPKRWTPIAAGTPGLGKPGEIALLSYDSSELDDCKHRKTLEFTKGKSGVHPRLGEEALDNLKMLFGAK